RAHAKRDLTAVGPVWRLAALGTKGEVVVEAVAKGLFDFGERRALEGDHVAKAGDGPGKRRRRPRPSRNNLYIPAPILPPVYPGRGASRLPSGAGDGLAMASQIYPLHEIDNPAAARQCAAAR